MTTKERIGFWLVAFMLTIASILVLSLNAEAQVKTYCDTLAHDNVILNRLVDQLDAQVAERGRQIGLLKVRVSLTDSTAEINRKTANTTIVRLTGERNSEHDRADAAETALNPVRDERDRLKGKTAVGRLLRHGRDVLAVVGAVTVFVITLKLVLLK